VGATAVKDASRRANARWPHKNEAILDRGGTHCPGMFRPGRENGSPAEPENVGSGCWSRTQRRARTAGIFRCPGGSRLPLAVTGVSEAESACV
jgi:hypothetical protein